MRTTSVKVHTTGTFHFTKSDQGDMLKLKGDQPTISWSAVSMWAPVAATDLQTDPIDAILCGR